MIQYDRFQYILEMLHLHNSVKVADLSRELQTSESTIRRDIVELEAEGKLRKVFGGAVSVSAQMPVRLIDMASKSVMNMEEKRRIARYAADLIEDGDFVYIDAGTTTGAMIEFLSKKQVTYVTNGLRHALELSAKGFEVLMLPGNVKTITESSVGIQTVQEIQKMNFTKSFIGVDAVDLSGKLTTADTDEANLKAEVIRRSANCYSLIDHTKFDTVSFVCFAGLSETIIITDDKVGKEYYKKAKMFEAS